jgi:hypothetical protein
MLCPLLAGLGATETLVLDATVAVLGVGAETGTEPSASAVATRPVGLNATA